MMDKAQLVKRCQAGDREAFGFLYHTYFTAMRGVVSYYIQNADVAQDIVHDGFLIAFYSIGSLKSGAKIEAWLTSIMKNLSLQYLKNESSHKAVAISDAEIDDNLEAAVEEPRQLSWKELSEMIDQLLEGYGQVSRLAVLDGLSHKEIAALLGIAPHSSSSQLSHAKALLRRLITEYRAEAGILLIVGILLHIWYGIVRHVKEIPTVPIVSKQSYKKTPVVFDSLMNIDMSIDSVKLRYELIDRTMRQPEAQHNISEVITLHDSVPMIENDIDSNDTIIVIPSTNEHELIAKGDLSRSQHSATQEWSLALTYSGSIEQRVLNRYRMADPNLPDGEGPADEIEVTEKTRHYMPLVIGLSVKKLLTSRWSMETGLRYTFLRSDFHSESLWMYRETMQHIHYIGVPFKLNYRIFSYKRFSLYGQGGGALDIPVSGTQWHLEYSPNSGTANKDFIHIHAPLQWSVEGGIGIEYHFTPSMSIYAEPSFRYYFNTTSDIKTIRQEKPMEFTIPIGLRLTW